MERDLFDRKATSLITARAAELKENTFTSFPKNFVKLLIALKRSLWLLYWFCWFYAIFCTTDFSSDSLSSDHLTFCHQIPDKRKARRELGG